MGFYFHYQCNCSIEYSDDPVPNSAVIYASDILCQYNEQESTYKEFIGNPTGYIFLQEQWISVKP